LAAQRNAAVVIDQQVQEFAHPMRDLLKLNNIYLAQFQLGTARLETFCTKWQILPHHCLTKCVMEAR